MKQKEKSNRRRGLLLRLSVAMLLVVGLGMNTPALAGWNRQAVDKTLQHKKNELQHANAGRDMLTTGIQREISKRSQDIEQGTQMIKKTNNPKQKVLRNIR